jgi:hypothetical protein
MNRCKTLLLVFFAIYASQKLNGQLQFDFENADLSQWSQNSADRWAISGTNPISGNYSLHHHFDNPVAGNDQISIPYFKNINFNDTVSWAFRIKHNYNPSAGNNWAIFLTSEDEANMMTPTLSNSAIVAGVNFSGSDDLLKIWNVENSKVSVALETAINWEETVGTDSSALIIVTRYPDSIFTIQLSATGNLENLKLVGTSQIKSNPNATYFGIYYKYSATQDRKLWIDDIAIRAKFIEDTIPPTVNSSYINSANSIAVVFNETIKHESLNTSCELINSNLTISYVEIIKSNILVINLNTNINENAKINLRLNGFQDLNGNIMPTKELTIYNYLANTYDISINEIMADPSPAVALPDCEFIELYNRTNYDINIEKWKLTIGNSSYTLPVGIIEANNYILLCSNNSLSQLSKYGKTIGAWTSDQILTNSGNTILLNDSSGKLMACTNYSDDYFTDNYKKSGGWSLEMIDPSNPCEGMENWKASKNKAGGTPGAVNSVLDKNQDITNPELLSFAVPNDSCIVLNFSETLNFSILSDSLSFFIDNGIGNQPKIKFLNNLFKSIVIELNKKLELGKTYELTIHQKVCDCAENKLHDDIKLNIALPALADSFDVVLNELLFNPFPYCAGFVELYNHSNKVLDAGELIIATIDTVSMEVKTFAPVAEKGTLFNPNSYLLVTKNIENLKKYYTFKTSGNLLEQSDFPTFDDKHGQVAIMKKDMSVIDKFEYNENMHNSLLNNTEGVSLERLNVNSLTNSSMNWQSAAQTAGFATPGYKNSQTIANNEQNNGITVSPEVFSPNNDGTDDFVTIYINQDLKEFTATIKIYSASGIFIKNIITKQYLGSLNQFIWDGTSEDHIILYSGIYIIHIQLFNSKGTMKNIKKTCVLGKF